MRRKRKDFYCLEEKATKDLEKSKVVVGANICPAMGGFAERVALIQYFSLVFKRH